MSSQQQVTHLLHEADKCKIEMKPRRPTQSIPNKQKMTKAGFEKKKKMSSETKEKAHPPTLETGDECASPRRRMAFGGAPMPCMMIAEELNKRKKRETGMFSPIKESSNDNPTTTQPKSDVNVNQPQQRMMLPVGGFKKPSEMKKEQNDTVKQQPSVKIGNSGNVSPKTTTTTTPSAIQRPSSMYVKPTGSEIKRERSGAALMAEQMQHTTAFERKVSSPISSSPSQTKPVIPDRKEVPKQSTTQPKAVDQKPVTDFRSVLASRKVIASSPSTKTDNKNTPSSVKEEEKKDNPIIPAKKDEKTTQPIKSQPIEQKPVNTFKKTTPNYGSYSKKEESQPKQINAITPKSTTEVISQNEESKKLEQPNKEISSEKQETLTKEEHQIQQNENDNQILVDTKEMATPPVVAQQNEVVETSASANESEKEIQPNDSKDITINNEPLLGEEKKEEPTPPPKKEVAKPTLPTKKEEPITDFRSVLFNSGKTQKEEPKQALNKPTSPKIVKPTLPPKKEEPITDFRSVLFNSGKTQKEEKKEVVNPSATQFKPNHFVTGEKVTLKKELPNIPKEEVVDATENTIPPQEHSPDTNVKQPSDVLVSESPSHNEESEPLVEPTKNTPEIEKEIVEENKEETGNTSPPKSVSPAKKENPAASQFKPNQFVVGPSKEENAPKTIATQKEEKKEDIQTKKTNVLSKPLNQPIARSAATQNEKPASQFHPTHFGATKEKKEVVKPTLPPKKEEPTTDFRSVLFNSGKTQKEEPKQTTPPTKKEEPIADFRSVLFNNGQALKEEKKEEPKQTPLSKKEEVVKSTTPPKKEVVKSSPAAKKEEPMTDFRSVLFNGGKTQKEEKKEEVSNPPIQPNLIKPSIPSKTQPVGTPATSKPALNKPTNPKVVKSTPPPKKEEPITDFRSVLFNGGKSLTKDN